MSKSRARKFADMFSTSLADVLEGRELDKTAVGGLTDVEAKADANAATVSALHTVATTGDYNDLSNKPAADITAVTAGSGLTGGGTSGAVTINHQDTSSQGSVNNSGNTVIQDIYLDTYGHVTAINSKTISAGASTTYNAVGTYVFGARYGTAVNNNSTYSGSQIEPAGIFGGNNTNFGDNSYDSGYVTKGSGTLSGTWRAMGRVGFASGSNIMRITLFVRIS